MIWIVRFVAAFALTSVMVTLLSSAAAQDWRPATDRPALEPEREKPLSRTRPHEFTQQTATVPAVADGDDALEAWILRPTAAAVRPGAVLIPGAGSGGRDTLLPEARALAAAGVATIVYDRRPGHHALHRDFDVMAADALAAAEVLRSTAGVDPTRVGLVGWSEGGWVIAQAARRAPDRIAFAGLMSAPIVTPGDQVLWSARQVMPAMPRWLEKTTATVIAGGQELLAWTAYDSEPGLAALDVPVIAFWGCDDRIVPVNEAVGILVSSVSGPLSIHVLADAGHQMRIDSGYLGRTAAWIISDPPPGAELRGVPASTDLGIGTLPAPSWSSHPLVLTTISAALAAAAAAPHRRRRPAATADPSVHS